MKRFYAIAVGVLLCAGWVISNPQVANDSTLTFDAANRSFSTSMGPSLRSGGFVKVCIVNPNTFREKYTISLDGKDFHNIALPDALKGLIARSTPGAVTVEEGFTQYAGMVNVRTELPPPFGNLYANYADSVSSFATQLLIERKGIQADIGQKMVKKIATAPTNYAAVLDVVDVVKDLLPPKDPGRQTLENYKKQIVVCDCSGDENLARPPEPVLDLNVVFTETVDNQLNGLNQAYAALQKAALMWDLAYNRWSLLIQPGTPPDDSIADANKRVTASRAQLDTAYKVKLDSLNGLRDQLRRAADLFRYCLDRNKVPICIMKTYAVPPSADVVRASIKVEQLGAPFTALEQVDTKPTAQQITSDNPASSQIYLRLMPVYGRTVVDYSSGLVVTTLRNQNWFIGSDMKVQLGPGDKTNLAIAGLAHLYKTSPNLVIPALTLGVALGDNTRYLAGVTAVINLNIARAMLTGGVAFGKVTVLNNHLDVGATTTASAVPTATVQRMGMFFGLSFNINL